jgi:hypothetical protein
MNYEEEQKARDLLAECDECISNGMVDNFASYEEGVRDVLLWLLDGGHKPYIGREV